MHVEQTHITTIRLYDAKGSEFSVHRNGSDYELRITLQNDVVNILLTYQDLFRLCQQMIPWDVRDYYKTVPAQHSYLSQVPAAKPCAKSADWLGFN